MADKRGKEVFSPLMPELISHRRSIFYTL